MKRVELENLPVNTPSAKSPPSTTGDQLPIQVVEQNIKGIISDAENFTMNSSSLPPQLMATLEYLREHLQALVEQQQIAHLKDVDEIKGNNVSLI